MAQFNPDQLKGGTVVDSDGSKLGTVDDVYVDDETGRPEWAAVKTGMFGNHVSMVPLQQAEYDGESLRVPYDKDQLKDAPHRDPEGELSREDESDLYRHYGMEYTTAPSSSGLGTGGAGDLGDSGDLVTRVTRVARVRPVTPAMRSADRARTRRAPTPPTP